MTGADRGVCEEKTCRPCTPRSSCAVTRRPVTNDRGWEYRNSHAEEPSPEAAGGRLHPRKDPRAGPYTGPTVPRSEWRRADCISKGPARAIVRQCLSAACVVIVPLQGSECLRVGPPGFPGPGDFLPEAGGRVQEAGTRPGRPPAESVFRCGGGGGEGRGAGPSTRVAAAGDPWGPSFSPGDDLAALRRGAHLLAGGVGAHEGRHGAGDGGPELVGRGGSAPVPQGVS